MLDVLQMIMIDQSMRPSKLPSMDLMNLQFYSVWTIVVLYFNQYPSVGLFPFLISHFKYNYIRAFFKIAHTHTRLTM